MNSVEESSYLSPQGTTTPVAVTPASKDTVDRLHSEKVKMNATPNGYSSVPNHKTKLDSHGMPKKHDSSKSNDHHKHSSDSSKHNSDHAKRKDGDSHKHASKQSSNSHSKSKDSSVSKDGSTKVHSSKSNDISKPKEHNHDKEKKHSSSIIKNRESSEKHSESSKHGIVKKESEKSKSEDMGSVKKEKSSHEKSKSDNFKENEKAKEKLKEGKMHEHKDKLKEKSKDHDKHKDKSKEHDKHRDKSKEHDKSKDKIKKTEVHKDKSNEKPKDKTDKPKDKSGDKLKDKSFDKLRDKSFDKLKEKTLEKPKDKTSEKPKDKGEKVKEKTKVKHRDSSSEKHSSDHLKKTAVEGESYKAKSLSPVKIKVEAASPKKIKEDPLSEDDVPLSARKPIKDVKPKVAKRVKEELEDDDEPLSSRIDKVKKIKTENSSSKKRKIESDDEEYESDYGKPAKKVKKAPPKKQKVKNEPEAPSPTKKRGKKEEEQEVWKWWEEEKLEDGCKWRTLEHNGPVFAPLYERVPKSVKFYYDGKHMALSEVTEEVAGFYGRMLDHEYTTKDSFNTNFFKDWRKVMIPSEKEIIKDLSKCNFNDFDKYYKLKSEERKSMTKEQKNEIKKQNEEMTQKYGFCIIDGHRQKIGNFRIEPPGLFRGRGEHPKMGMLKRRVQPEDILINIGKQAPIPEPPAGHKWKEVRHDNAVTWLASWNENILNSTKYIMLNPSSKLKGEKDWQKYETARKLKNHAGRIRKTYEEDFKSKEMRVRQRAVALYFIDKLALRAGNEKDEETADTVGCCSLRVEHITLDDEKDGQEYVVSFDFLGKDSIRYENSVAVEKRAYKNLKLFMDNKQPGDDLFDRLNTGILNKYLNELMEGLTAKVFRTYNASKTLQEQLDLLTKEEMSVPEKVLAYNRANRAVALLCNHQRSVPKGFSKSMENLKGKMDDKLAQIKECKRELKSLKSDQKNSGSMKDKVLYEKKKKRLQTLEEQFQKLEVQATDKEENKQIALGTSKLNYLDPRISVAWCKKWNVPIEKVYNRTQRDKFRWAIEMAGPEFTF